MDNCQVELIEPWKWAVLTILQEARNQTLDGMIGVAEVIRNRTEKGFYSDGTIIGTVLKDRQFSGWNASDPNRIICGKYSLDDPRVSMAIKAWKLAINNRTDLTGGAFFYHTRMMSPFPDWASSPGIIKTTMIGDHIFYKKVS